MKEIREDNTIGVIQRAIRHFRIHVTNNSVKEALISHSNYPTFKSICDTLSEWNIDHYPLKYQPEELLEISVPYIVHFTNGGGQIAFVSHIKNDKVIFYESYNFKREITIKDYLERCSGAIILLNPDKRSGEYDYNIKWQNEMIGNSVLPVSISIFLLTILLSLITLFVHGGIGFDKLKGLLFLTKTAGIVLSIFLVLHEFDVHLALTDKLCHLNRATDCSTVLHDKASKIFGWFGWADVGIVYFSGGLLILLQSLNGQGLSLLAILSALSLPYPVFSIYYQGFVLKKWCPMCLGVQLTLIFEFILLIPLFSDINFSFIGLSSLILTFLITGIVYTLFIMYLNAKKSNEVNYYRYLAFKKNPEVLRTLILNQNHFDIPITSTSLVFGNKNAPLKITAFLSLHCSHCAKTYKKISKILKSQNEVSINLVLITSESKLINSVYNLKRSKKDAKAMDLLDKWFNADPYSISKLSETLCVPDENNISNAVNEQNKWLIKECNVIGTPSFFINGYNLPKQYDIDDILDFPWIFNSKK